jgi:hypothetical protein
MYTPDKRLILAVANVAAFWGLSFAPCLAAELPPDMSHVTSALSTSLRAAQNDLRDRRCAYAISKLKKADRTRTRCLTTSTSSTCLPVSPTPGRTTMPLRSDSACVTAYSKRLNGPRDPLLIDPKLRHDSMLQANASSP